MKELRGCHFAFVSIAIALISSCSTSKPYRAKYEAAWEKLVESEAWQESLRQSEITDNIIEADVDGDIWLSDEKSTTTTADPFQAAYDSWVNQAYFKIISEAEEADGRIKAEYSRFLAENPDAARSEDENVVKILSLYKKKYEAHETMLSGLKSWHAFEDFGSDDLKFFKKEQEEVVRSMYRRGHGDKQIVDFLVYKLADLYHLDADITD